MQKPITREQKDKLISSMSWLIVEVLELFIERDIWLDLKREDEDPKKIVAYKYKVNEQYDKCLGKLDEIRDQLQNTKT